MCACESQRSAAKFIIFDGQKRVVVVCLFWMVAPRFVVLKSVFLAVSSLVVGA